MTTSQVNVRIDSGLLAAARKKAADDSATITAVVSAALERYTYPPPPDDAPGDAGECLYGWGEDWHAQAQWCIDGFRKMGAVWDGSQFTRPRQDDDEEDQS